jgi:serine/threonine protein kinase
LQVKLIVRQVLEGLHYLHSVCGVIHCDVKPENVLLATTRDQVRRLAAEALDLAEAGQPLPPAFVSANSQLPVRQRRRSTCFWGKVKHSIVGPEVNKITQK